MKVKFMVVPTARGGKRTPVEKAVVTTYAGKLDVLSGDRDWVTAFLDLSPIFGVDGRRLTPADGEEYLRALAAMFTGTYLRAELED